MFLEVSNRTHRGEQAVIMDEQMEGGRRLGMYVAPIDGYVVGGGGGFDGEGRLVVLGWREGRERR